MACSPVQPENSPLAGGPPPQPEMPRHQDTIQPHQQSWASCSQKPAWVPLSLQRITLATFYVSYALIALVIAVLAWYSRTHNGMFAANSEQQFIWTYLPTTLFVVIAALWGHVDYHARLLMPWALMSKQPQPAARSVLLDYISPTIPLALISSLRAKDVPVAVALCGSVLNKLLIIFSAGLLVLAPVEVLSAPKSVRGSSFSESLFNRSVVNLGPASRVYGVESFNMSYPLGTSEALAMELPPFINESRAAIDNVVKVDLFIPSLDCQNASLLGIAPKETHVEPFLSYGGKELLPYSGNGRYEPSSWTTYTVNVSAPSCPSFSTENTVRDGRDRYIFDQVPVGSCNDSDYRFVLVLLEDRSREKFPFLSEPRQQKHSSVIVCKPKYFIRPAEVRYSPSVPPEVSTSILNISQSPREDRILETAVSRDLFLSFIDSVSLMNFFTMQDLINITASHQNLTAFTSSGGMQQAFENAFKAVSVQIANKYLLEGEKDFSVQELFVQNRLHFHGVGFWLTEFTLLLLVTTSGYLAYKFRESVVPRDPGSLAGISSILASSKGPFLEKSAGAGLSSLETIHRKLSSVLFETKVRPSFTASPSSFEICTKPSPTRELNTEKDGAASKDLESVEWHKPFIISKTARALLITAGLILVTVLEGIYQVSRRRNGFLTLTESEYTHYSWKHFPVAWVLLFTLAFGALDFEMKTFQPFHRLLTGGPAAETIDENYFSQMDAQALWNALLRKQYCITATSTAAILSPFLIIFAAGLHFAEPSFQTETLTFQNMDSFNLNTFNVNEIHNIPEINYQRDGMMAANLVINDNMPLPQWTYDSFVVPKLQLSPPGQQIQWVYQAAESKAHVLVKTLAFQANANCGEIAASAAVLDSAAVRVDFGNLPSCGKNDDKGAAKEPLFFEREEGYFGFWVDRVTHCQDYIVVAGQNHEDGSTDIKALRCAPFLDTVKATVGLTCPDLKADRSVPPQLHEASRKQYMSVGIPEIGRRLSNPFFDDNSPLQPAGTFDGFFAALTHNGANASALASDPGALKAAVEALYRRIFAQAMHLTREANPQASKPRLTKGELLIESRMRLKQSAVSTRALEFLLLAMIGCVGATFLLDNTKKVLPKNPRSIAAQASLLAGSQLLDEVIPPGSEWLGDKELRQERVFEGLDFRMGYWEDKVTGEVVRFGIDVSGRDKNSGDGGAP